MADLPSPSPGGFPNLPRSGNWFFRGLAFVKDVYDAMNRRRNRYDDRPAPDPQPSPPPPPPPSPSFGDDGAPGLEFREPVFAPVLKVTEADLSTPEPAPTPTPATTTTTTTGPTPIPATTTTTTTGPTPTLTPTTTTTTTTTTTGPRPAPSPTPATMTTTTTTSSPTLTSEPAQPIPAITTTAPPPAPISTTTTTDPDPTEISLLCRARNAILHLLPDGKRIATYLAFLLAASGVITVVWVLTRSSRTGGEQVPEAEAEPGLRYSLNDVGGSKHNGSVLNQLDCDDTAFCTYSLEELKMATDEFSPKRILSQDGEHAPNNIVYHGTIPSFGRVAIKRFGPNAWPDSNVFLKEARNVGCLRSGRIANLIGCCCENGECLIVAEFMPYQNLTETIHGNAKPMSWALRVQIALHLAQSLEYCKRNGRALYHKLNADKILFDAHGNTRLATFGLMKENSDDTGIVPVIDNTLVYSFGLILLALLKKKNVSLSKALDSMREKEFIPAMDSSLAGQAYTSDVIQLMQLAYSCLQDNAQEQPDLTKIVSILASFQIYDSVSDIGKAYASGKINELHDALESDAYSEDEMIGCKEPSELWSGQPVDIINAKNHGDSAFRSKQYSLVVKLYSLIVDSGAVDSPTVLARRSFASVVLGKLEEGLEDARKAGQISPDWPTAFYLQGMALIGLGKLEGHEKIKIGSVLEDKRSGRYEG